MKISIYLLACAALLLAAGCAHTPGQGASSGSELGGVYQAQVHSERPSAIEDYPEILADPGPF